MARAGQFGDFAGRDMILQQMKIVGMAHQGGIGREPDVGALHGDTAGQSDRVSAAVSAMLTQSIAGNFWPAGSLSDE